VGEEPKFAGFFLVSTDDEGNRAFEQGGRMAGRVDGAKVR
jgi:hypothetical protein